MICDLYEKYRACGCRVSTDSRSLIGGEMFFALKGENFNGNAYARKALEAGAAWAVVDEDVCQGDPRAIRVENSYETLKQLAVYHRNNVLGGKHLPVIGLTGTNGKTTTKELIRAVLAAKYRVCATEGNLNNDIGVPLSLLKITPDTEIAVIEMGASHPDDIRKLVRISRPDCGLITNVGMGHLLGFGSFEGVKAAKCALYDYISEVEGGFIFLNADDPVLSEMAASRKFKEIRTYGVSAQGAVVLPSTPREPFVRIQLGDTVVKSKLIGAYNATNILAALAVAEAFDVPFADAVSAIEAYTPSNNRSQMMLTDRNSVIVDAYNANPSSMAAALAHFSNAQAPVKWALLGDMGELGDYSVAEHEKILAAIPYDVQACLVGEEFGKAYAAVGSPASAMLFGTSDELVGYLHEHPLSGALVLVKGSRFMRMEKVLQEL